MMMIMIIKFGISTARTDNRFYVSQYC